ncbi:hypothetical protein ACSVIJ_07090 [Pseudomonas sp. NCHU5208]|uniref:hypothetical protein n=1 Tax=unclassified Pseudomonas TaxID=196821 RepID=UPI003F9456A4
MFRKLFGKNKTPEKVFIIPFHVKALDQSIMPPDIGGAYVSCYTSGASYLEATEKALKKLAADGLHPQEILQPIHEMLTSSWTVHINEQWSDHVGNLPAQAQFEEHIEAGGVVYGPFGSYAP